VSLPGSRWVLATRNRGKMREFEALLERSNLEVVPLDAFDPRSPPETGATFIENALIKARHATQHTGLPAIADDSGLVVAALNGEPGVLSARFAGPQADDDANRRKLLELMADLPPPQRRAHFECVIVALRGALDPTPIVVQGRWHGRIALKPAGLSGFGYDPIFYDQRLDATAAELQPAVKNRVSHRGQAMAELLRRFEDAGLGA
jgi:XTP/dITP diphosphohydrolase